jgi:hypothetical protein
VHTDGCFTIRFYSDEGLPPTNRTAAGYRIYDVRSLAALELVKTLRSLGLGLTPAAEWLVAALRASAGDLTHPGRTGSSRLLHPPTWDLR